MEVKNAVIESVTLEKGDRGFLQCWLHLSYGGSGQGFGGYVLYLPKSFAHHSMQSVAGHFMFRCMEVAGVDNWADMPGRTIRVRADNGKVYAIGHIVKDDWFDPAEDFSAKAAQAKRGAVPEGWKLVPIDPTPEMIEAAASFGGRGGYNAQHGDECAIGYRDMLSAAPAPAPAEVHCSRPNVACAAPDCGPECRHREPAPAECRTCSGHGMVGGLLPNGGGYESTPCPACTAPAPAKVSMPERLADAIVREVAELPDRDSPADWPAAMLVTSDELRGIVHAALHGEAKPAKCDGNHGGPRCADPECWNDGPIALILDELRRAVTKFPTWPTDPLHALAVLGEEFGELTKATLQTTYEPHKSSHDDVRTEAIQTAAMALRFVISLERYEYTQGIQHQQEGQPA